MLRCCQALSGHVTKDDIVILGFGTHDNDIHKFHSNLCIAINMLNKSKIYIVPVFRNLYFNEIQLFNCMKLWTKHFDKCTLIDINDFILCSDYNLKKNICNKINLCIDYCEYKKQFLTCKNLRNLMKNNVREDNVKYTDILPKRSTIPFYFKVLNKTGNSKNDKILLNTVAVGGKIDTNGSKMFFRD